MPPARRKSRIPALWRGICSVRFLGVHGRDHEIAHGRRSDRGHPESRGDPRDLVGQALGLREAARDHGGHVLRGIDHLSLHRLAFLYLMRSREYRQYSGGPVITKGNAYLQRSGLAKNPKKPQLWLGRAASLRMSVEW